MAALTQTESRVVGIITVTEQTLTASDTLTYMPARKQLLVLRNDTAGVLTATIDGADGTSVTVDGLGSVSVAAGFAVAVPANSVRAVVLNTISAYLQGVVSVTGGAGIKAQLVGL